MSVFKKLVCLSLCLVACVSLPSMVEGKQNPEPVIELIGEVSKKSELPDPSTAAYPDCLMFLKFKVIKVIKGQFNSNEALVAMWGFKNYKLSEPGKFAIGDKVKLKLIPYKSVENELSGLMRVDDTQDYDSELYWAPVWEIQEKQQKDVSEISKIFKPTAIDKTNPKSDVVGKVLRILKAHGGEIIGGPDAKMLFGSYSYLITSSFWEAPKSSDFRQTSGSLHAIVEFAQYLKRKNIQLVMVFPPSPVAIYPEFAANIDYNFDRDGRIDIYFLEFLNELRVNNIFYVDLLPEFIRNKWIKGPDNNTYPLYYQDDPHWTEIAASLAGKAVARSIMDTEWFQNIAQELQPKSVEYKESFKIGTHYPGIFSKRNPNWNYPPPKFIIRNIIPDAKSDFIMKSDPISPVWIIGDSFLLTKEFHQDIAAKLGLSCNILSIPGGSTTPAREAFARIHDTSKIKIVIWEITSSWLADPSMWKKVEFNQ